MPDGSETAGSSGRLGVDPLPAGPDGMVCSARGCSAPAEHDLRWNNPKIHPADRRKHWLACSDHRESLSGYLSARGLLREVLAVDPAAQQAGPG